MRGDFSAWNKDRSQNFRGTLHQQGRVLLDRDWNAQTEIIGEWQETAGRDAFGAGVAAVPAEVPASFKVTKAEKITTVPAHVEVSVSKGRVWADGLLVESTQDMVRTATYLGPPIQAIPLPNDLPANGDRDAVILETWLVELSPFQAPNLLIEPALGGVDTTERVQTAYRFRLFRMADGETCDSINPKLKDDFDAKGKLTAKLNDTQETDGDCPVVESGGYTGFEHRLYRIEIAAQTEKPGSWFKWSQFNGGLVGRGVFRASNTVDIKANQNAIAHCGISKFYLEALKFDTALGCWQVKYGVNNVTLNADNTLTLPTASSNVFFGSVPPETGAYFFRLWNGIEKISDYSPSGKDLPDLVGIKLKFDSADPAKYKPSDFWTFEVRVGQGVDSTTPPLVDNKPPQGIFYHRVPLAEVWADDPSKTEIEDCRRIYQPLTKLKTCCTYRVGDGVHSHGDFTKIQDAINALPKDGGEICILPGKYEENVFLFRRFNRDAIIILKGCGDRTRIFAKDAKLPVITIAGVSNVTVESMYLINPESGGILMLGEARGGDDAATLKGDDVENKIVDYILKTKKEADDNRRAGIGPLVNICLDRLRIDAGFKSGIRMYTGYFVSITNCRVFMDDINTENPGVFLSGDDIDFECNQIQVEILKQLAGDIRPEMLTNLKRGGIGGFGTMPLPVAEKATGGLQLAGGCERIRVIDNLIVGGNGNGITLGSVDVIESTGLKRMYATWNPNAYHAKGDCFPNSGSIPDPDDPGTPGEPGVRYEIGPPLYDILIERNRIFSMGRNGIGVEAFAAIKQKAGAGSVNKDSKANVSSVLAGLGRLPAVMIERLTIIGNCIERCVSRSLPEVSDGLSLIVARGGISLSIVDGLVIRDNDIVENGPSYVEPVCGIFVLMGLGVEISRNRIFDNGANPGTAQAGTAPKQGARGGILIFMAADGISKNAGASGLRQMSPSGELALKLHENIVSTPLGRALTMFYRGHVSISDNQLRSLQAEPISVILPTTVFILGIDGLKNMGALMAAAFGKQQGSTQKIPGKNVGIFGDQFMNGALEFANNQVEAIYRETVAKDGFLALCSILIFTGGDVSFLGNQCFARHPGRYMGANTMLAGGTLRAVANSWLEYPGTAYLSAITLGMLNTTTDNQSTHCLLIRGSLFVDNQNLTMIDAAGAYDASGNPIRPIDGDIPNPETLCRIFNAIIPPIVYPIEQKVNLTQTGTAITGNMVSNIR